MKILCTFPGKYGDLLWALPTIRAISRRVGEPVHLRIAANFASIVPLLQHQPYLASVKAYLDWTTEDTAPISPRIPPDRPHAPGTQVIHLGYRQWPDPDVVQETLHCYIAWRLADFDRQRDFPPLTLPDLALETPWIEAPRTRESFYWPWQFGFTDEHFELKYGLIRLLEGEWKASILSGLQRQCLPPIGLGRNLRWETEASSMAGTTWEESADLLNHCGVFLSDCSALHVLAVAMGVPVVVMEPQEARWNPVFYPLGTDGPHVTLVRGSDGRPTFDARHVADVLKLRTAQRKDRR